MTRLLSFLAALVIGLQPIATSAQYGALLDYPPNFVPQQFGAGSIVMDFANGGYYGRSLPDLTVSRASNETCPDSSGNYLTVGSNLPCIGPGLGINAWESRTNGIRNNSMTGAVAGSPGTLPTNWVTALRSGMTVNVIGTGVESGENYIDLQLTGTPGSTGANIIQFESNTQVTATYGQTWAGSAFVYLSGGSLTNVVSVQLVNQALQSGGAGGIGNQATTFTPGAGPLGVSRISSVFTPSSTLTAFENLTLAINVTSGQAVNITLRIGWPQLENNSLINSSVASATVNAGGTLYTPSSSGTVTWSGAGCTTNPVLNVTTSTGGVINAVTSVATAGSCTTFPSSSATTWTDGTGLGTGSGASFNLVPVNNAAQGFATPPIVTSGSAATRAADTISMNLIPGSAYSMALNGTPAAPSAYSVPQIGLQIGAGSANNRALLYIQSVTGLPFWIFESGGSSEFNTNIGAIAWGQTPGKLAASFMAGTQVSAFNGIAGGGQTGATMPVSPTTLQIGSNAAGVQQWNGTIALIAVQPNIALPAAVITQDTRLSLDLTCEGPWYGRKCRMPANDNSWSMAA